MIKPIITLGAFALILTPVVAHADLKWTETTTMGAAQNMSMSTTKWAKKDAQRSETSMKMGPMEMKTVEISRCGDKKTYQLAPELKEYAVTDLQTSASPMAGMAPMGRPMPQEKPGPPQNGTSDIDMTTKDLGAEVVAGIPTRHYSLTMKVTSTGCAGKGTKEMTLETWVADIHYPAPCLEPRPEEAFREAARIKPACDVKTTFHGDLAGMKKAYGGFVMRMKMNMGGQDIVKEVTMLSQAALPDDPFIVPADWKEVSAAELQKAKRQAVMKAMMGGMMPH